jgi:predicted TIM-barrel fold metal-dependent hydrolase
MNQKALSIAFALLSAICAHLPVAAQSNAKSTERSVIAAKSSVSSQLADRTRITPFADYHKHLRGPGATQLQSRPMLTEIKVPEDLARLLNERSRRWNDKSAIAELYTENAVLHDNRVLAWYKGRSAIAAFVITRFRAGYSVTPVAYNLGQSNGYVAGYLTRTEKGVTTHFMHVHLSLEKGEDGLWRIAAETFTYPGPEILKPITAEQIIAELDAAGIKRGVVISVAYWFGNQFLNTPFPDEYEKVRAENDWVAEQVARYPDRLTAFCSFNPLKDYALQELERCAKNPLLKGLKLHFGNSGVDVRKPEHLEKVRRVFRVANQHRMPIIAHLWTDWSYEKEAAQHAAIFLNQVLPESPNITIQIAHMAGGGRSNDLALAVYADAITAKDPRTRNLYFDIATLVEAASPDQVLQRDAMRMRQIGFERILWGSDMSAPEALSGQQWRIFRGLMPLTDDELKKIASNIAPYLR